jgi:hypothetical protein
MRTWEQYYKEEESKEEPSDADFLANAPLDAYGHLSWAVGNEDWLACLDAVLSPTKDRIAYHVVVDCESGGFTDTAESGVLPIKDAEQLKKLPYKYLDYVYEQYNEEEIDFDENYKTIVAWCEHIDSLNEKGAH